MPDRDPRRPGSPQAIAAGCRCPRESNGWGLGLPGADGRRWWWVEPLCGLHRGELEPGLLARDEVHVVSDQEVAHAP